MESFAKREGYEVFKVYCDDGISAYSTRREALQQLLKDAKDKKFDLVLVYKIDRFSRNLKDLLNLVDDLSSCGGCFQVSNRAIRYFNISRKIDVSTTWLFC